jgi:hypothetical protein
MPKKIGGGGHYNFIFFLNHILHKIERTPGEHTERTPSIFQSEKKPGLGKEHYKCMQWPLII